MKNILFFFIISLASCKTSDCLVKEQKVFSTRNSLANEDTILVKRMKFSRTKRLLEENYVLENVKYKYKYNNQGKIILIKKIKDGREIEYKKASVDEKGNIIPFILSSPPELSCNSSGIACKYNELGQVISKSIIDENTGEIIHREYYTYTYYNMHR